jgi:hypothetical protein
MALSQDPGLTAQLINILNSPACMAINFKWMDQQINSSGYQDVVQALTAAKIGTGFANFSGGAKAGYVALNAGNPVAGLSGNTFYFDPTFTSTDALSRVEAVHEATHAIQDLKGHRLMTVDEEGSAYFAGFLYNHYLPKQAQFPKTQMNNELWKVASGVAEIWGSDPPGDHTVSNAMMNAIVLALNSDQRFAAEVKRMPFVDNDGVP